MEFNLLVGDRLNFGTCKFKMAIFKSVQVIAENIRFASLYVQNIFMHELEHGLNYQICNSTWDTRRERKYSAKFTNMGWCKNLGFLHTNEDTSTFLTNGFSHHYHLEGSTFIFRGIRSDF